LALELKPGGATWLEGDTPPGRVWCGSYYICISIFVDVNARRKEKNVGPCFVCIICSGVSTYFDR